MGKLFGLISLLLLAGCTTNTTVIKSAFTEGTTAEEVADYMEMIECKDSCWVYDSTFFEWKIKCKGDPR